MIDENFFSSLKKLFFLPPKIFFYVHDSCEIVNSKKKSQNVFQKFFFFLVQTFYIRFQKFFLVSCHNMHHLDVITNTPFLGFGTGSARYPGRPSVALGGGIQSQKFRRFSAPERPRFAKKWLEPAIKGWKNAYFSLINRQNPAFLAQKTAIQGIGTTRPPLRGGLFSPSRRGVSPPVPGGGRTPLKRGLAPGVKIQKQGLLFFLEYWQDAWRHFSGISGVKYPPDVQNPQSSPCNYREVFDPVSGIDGFDRFFASFFDDFLGG